MAATVFLPIQNILKNNWKKVVLGSALFANSFFPVYAQNTNQTPIDIKSNEPPTTAILKDSNKSTKIKTTEEYLLDKLVEAQKILAKDCSLDEETVGISMLEKRSGQIYFIKTLKTNFITRGYQENFTLAEGSQITLRIDHPNFINTKVSIETSSGIGQFVPLMVKYPIVRKGMFKEMGYYVPAHYSLQTYKFAPIGDQYIEKVLANANKSLKHNNLDVSEKVFNLAKLLCIVEHIDHGRYHNENKTALFNEVRTLYALNRGNTYRYAVSSAGAGGMVQMISSTYREMKNSFPQVDWISDFEQAMMTHENAAKAMLLYLNRYYQFFSSNDTVANAWENQIATEEEIMAAGYNSNPVKVPRTLSQGEYWRRSLPQETQIYLSILRSLDSSVTVEPPTDYRAPERVTRVAYRPQRAKSQQIRNVRLKSRYKASSRYSTSRKAVIHKSTSVSSSKQKSYNASSKSKISSKAKAQPKTKSRTSRRR
ncbi:MAG: hypothetical protein WAQ98_05300 [Blastocatellia bacterium]